MKICSKCKETKPAECFYPNRTKGAGKLTPYCKECGKKNTIRYLAIPANRKRSRAIKHGISPIEYERMILAQENKCAICRKEEKKILLSIDHDHKTGAIRGLLCGSCNRGIGLLGDNPDRLILAAKYLTFWEIGLTLEAA